MPNTDSPLPTLFDFTQWLAGRLRKDEKPPEWMQSLFDSPHRETAWHLALRVSQLPNDYTPLVSISDDEQQKISEWACAICNAFIQPYHSALEEKPRNGGTSLSCSSKSKLKNITVTTKNAVSPTNQEGENEDGDNEAVILTLKAATATKARNHLLAALQLVDDHIKRYS